MSEVRANLIPDMAAIINVMYPVGRTIICDHNPETDYPWQTWEQSFKDRFPIGAGSTYAAGATGGEATHELTVSEMPAHSHTVNSHTHTYSNATSVQAHTLTTSEIPSHTHTFKSVGICANQGAAGTVTENFVMNTKWSLLQVASSSPDGYGIGTTTPGYIGGNGSHTHGLTKASANTGATAPGTSSSGGGTAHNNMPPYESVCFWTRTA